MIRSRFAYLNVQNKYRAKGTSERSWEGSRGWLAPEVLEGSAATLASDVFAMGVIFWELLKWGLPWGAANPWGIVSQVNAGNRLPIPAPAELPGPGSGEWDKLDAYLALMNRCWAQKPEDRPTFGEVMADLRNIDPAAVEANIN